MTRRDRVGSLTHPCLACRTNVAFSPLARSHTMLFERPGRVYYSFPRGCSLIMIDMNASSAFVSALLRHAGGQRHHTSELRSRSLYGGGSARDSRTLLRGPCLPRALSAFSTCLPPASSGLQQSIACRVRLQNEATLSRGDKTGTADKNGSSVP
eukprot:4616661-Amphidinium_carterae.1